MRRAVITFLMAMPISVVLQTAFIPELSAWYVSASVGMCAAMLSDAWVRYYDD